jgi:heavy metal sensor kinase
LIFQHLSIRHRLIMMNVLVVMIIIGILSTGIYFFSRQRLESVIQNKLDSGYTTVESVIRNSGGDIMDVYHLSNEERFRVFREGDADYQTEAWKASQLTELLEEGKLLTGESWVSETGSVFRLKRGLVPEYGFEIYYAIDTKSESENLRNLVLILLSGLGPALALAVLGGIWLAGQTLNPLTAITQKAKEIDAERLFERLPVLNPEDEIGQLSQVLNSLMDGLENSFQQLQRFTADASHELRTPLASMRSVGEVTLKRAEDSESYRESISSILEEIQRLTHLVDSLLVLARGDSGKIIIAPESVKIGTLVQEVVEELQVLAEEKEQNIQLQGEDTVELTTDIRTLKMSLTNILHNAIQYSPHQSEIKIQFKTDRNDFLVDVIDEGPGIPVADQQRVFERFYRLDKARSRKQGGTGLGLAIAKWGIEVNGGSIRFLEKVQPGACCRIRLPIKEIDAKIQKCRDE